jgi:hypothetical protein
VLAKLGVSEETVQLIKSFHYGMKARVHVDGAMLEKTEVQTGLGQVSCMAPVLFNLYTCLAVDRWLARAKDTEGVSYYNEV